MSAAKKYDRAEQIYDYLLERANPETGKIVVSGDRLGKDLKMAANTARLYLATLVKDGRVIQLTETREGAQTTYKVAALCKGDTTVTYIGKKPEPAIAWRSPEPPAPMPEKQPEEAPSFTRGISTVESELQDSLDYADRVLGDVTCALARLKRAAENMLREVQR